MSYPIGNKTVRAKAPKVAPPVYKDERTPEQKLRHHREMLVEIVGGARKSLTDYLELQRHRANSLTEELHRHISDIEDADKKQSTGSLVTTASDYFSWAVNDIENFLRNVNFSAAVSYAAGCTQAEEALKAFDAAHPEIVPTKD